MRKPRIVRVLVNDRSFEVEVLSRTHESVRFELADRVYTVRLEHSAVQRSTPTSLSKQHATPQPDLLPARAATGTGVFQIRAPIPGLVAEVLCNVGQEVEAGATVLRLEAMKMQNSILAPASGEILRIHVSSGQEVGDEQLLIEMAVASVPVSST